MKANKVMWFSIIGLGVYGAFTGNQWLSLVLAPLFMGLFVILANRSLVDDTNALYRKRAKRFSIFFPLSFLEKTSYKFQRWFAILAGILFILFAIANFIHG